MDIKLKEFKDMIRRVEHFLSTKKRPPRYVNTSMGRITYNQYTDALKRYTDFVKKNKREPKYVRIYSEAKPTHKPGGPNQELFEKTFNVQIESAQDLYAWLRGNVKYSYYYNDKYSNREVIKKIKRGEGINCTDLAQFCRPILRDLGYKCDFIRAEVKCSNNKWYGHVFLRIRGKEYNDWVYFDGTAVTHENLDRPLGKLMCTGGIREITINPKWLLNAEQNL